jgi:4-hydroxy-2-oxoheptanedioate aldolase
METSPQPEAFTSAIVSTTGKTRLTAALERAREGKGPCVGQWLEFPGATLARTVAGLGEDVRYLSCFLNVLAQTNYKLTIKAVYKQIVGAGGL